MNLNTKSEETTDSLSVEADFPTAAYLAYAIATLLEVMMTVRFHVNISPTGS